MRILTRWRFRSRSWWRWWAQAQNRSQSPRRPAFPTAGRARVLGRTPGDIAAKARIGYLPENHRYPSHLTGKQVLHYFARLSGLRDPERSRRVASLLKRLRMDAAGDVKVHRYSKGMMQRHG